MVLACLIPYMYLIRNGRSHEKRKSDAFSKHANRNSLNISKTDSWKNKTIGIDINKSSMLFIVMENSEEYVELVKLQDFKECRVIETHRTLAESGMKVMDKVSLELVRQKGVRPPKKMILFDIERDISLENEQQLANKWASIINMQINQR